ncbi:hypothetical protein Phou_090890 [Phytohabitans houttuyneae]|uniref:Uncharacterized protein n=1 Tax=Phytohabitans houttuyneae TaxID=1076126 RepID=A0A6V8KRL4_9ACTN|nr:hypothetical protein Phou_090890 [Phytohabitans houttuyneae]
MRRTFASHRYLVHDPATGMTHRAPDPQPTGRIILDDTIVASWPVPAAADLDRHTPASVCWSPIVRCNLHCPSASMTPPCPNSPPWNGTGSPAYSPKLSCSASTFPAASRCCYAT